MTHHHDHPEHGLPRDAEASGSTPFRLRPLSALDRYEVADGDPDVRGWRVKTGDGQWAGTVHDLVVDLETREVRYLDVALDRRIGTGRESSGALDHVLLPLALARLDDDADVVTLLTLTWPQLARLPAFEHEPFTRADECAVLGALAGRPGPVDATDPIFYDRAWFGASQFRGNCRGSGDSVYRVTGGGGVPPSGTDRL